MEGNKRFRSSSGRSFSGKRKPFKKRRDDDGRSSGGDRFSKPKDDFKSSDKPFAGGEKSFRGGPRGGGQGFKREGGPHGSDRPFSKQGKRSFSSGPGKFNKPFSKGPGGERSGPGRPDNGPRKERYSSNRPGKFEGERSKGSGDRFSSNKRDFRKPPRKDAFPGPSRERKSFVEPRNEKQRIHEGPEKVQTPQSGDDLLRLNRFISNSGVCSRREADDLIVAGLITVNGKPITELGFKVKRTDDVRYDGKRLKAEMPVYILLNKPKGYITTTDDPQERKTVMQLIQGACKERVYPVGRLDRNTSGLLLLTNDGDLTEKLSHPSHNVKKIYKAELDRPLTKNDFQKILEGVRLEEGKAVVDDLAIISDDGKTVGLEIHIGWNRLVRRIFEALGYEVSKLDRSSYASLTKKELARGHWRFLRPDEVIRLKHFL